MTRLYLISPPIISPSFEDGLEEALSAGDIAAFQLRLKNISDDEIIKSAIILKKICHKYNTPFFINDNIDIALKVKADGLHIGEDDGDIHTARKKLGAEVIIGVSCYNSMDKAIDAAENSANYISFGAFFDTRTKIPKARASLDLLEAWSKYTIIPSCAIGGINAENAHILKERGADFVAAISCIWEHKTGITSAVQEIIANLLPEIYEPNQKNS